MENDVHETKEYIVHEIYLHEGKDKQGWLVTAKTALRENHLVDDLAAGMLVENDVLVPEGIDLLFSKQTALLELMENGGLIHFSGVSEVSIYSLIRCAYK